MEISQQNAGLFPEGVPFRATRMWNELVKNFKDGVCLKKKRWRMKYYHNCFSGSEALAWIHEYLKTNPNYGDHVTRTQAQLLCQKFLQQNVVQDILPSCHTTGAIFEENRLYTFTDKFKCKKEYSSKAGEAKENEPSRTRKGTPLKRRPGNGSRKPFGERTGLSNITKELGSDEKMPERIECPKQLNARKKQTLSNYKDNLIVFNNSVAKSVQFHSDEVPSKIKKTTSGLSRKWKSECNVSLLKKNCEVSAKKSVTQQENDLKSSRLSSKAKVELPVVDISAKTSFCESEGTIVARIPQQECNELWKDICLERLKYAIKVTSLNGILDHNLLSWKNVKENVKSNSRLVTQAVPKWLISAMKYLIHWPISEDSPGDGSKYVGFEKDVFKTISGHFQSIPEPLVPRSFLEIFTKISGLSTRCKLSAIRALQHVLVLLDKNKRQQLQLLLRFMIKVSRNHMLHLSNYLPTRELVVQTFSPSIFSGGQNTGLTEVLGIRIASFIMDNYCEVFKVPEGLQYEVEQQIAFHQHRGQRDIKCQSVASNSAVTFCQRVTDQEYEEQRRFVTQRSLEELLNSIVDDENINEKERMKKLKQFQKAYPEIYTSCYPADGLSMISRKPEKSLRRVMKPLGSVIKSLR